MTLKILPHGRLQEWVAEEQGYFTAEGIEYTSCPKVFRPYTREVFAATQAWTRRVFPVLPRTRPLRRGRPGLARSTSSTG